VAITVGIPAPLRKITKDNVQIKSNGATVKELIDNLEKIYSGFKGNIYDEKGKARSFINIYVNDEDIRFLKKDLTPLKDGDEVLIIYAIAGG
jgi:molybdopterin synthase sulfur carrier subunit